MFHKVSEYRSLNLYTVKFMELNWKLSTAGDLSYVNAELLSRWRPIAWYDKAKNWPWISAKLIASKLHILAILETQKPPKPTETLRILPKPTETHQNPPESTETHRNQWISTGGPIRGGPNPPGHRISAQSAKRNCFSHFQALLLVYEIETEDFIKISVRM